MTNHFLLITTDGETENGRKASARTIIDWRLKRGRWPIYPGTRHSRSMEPGDLALFYQGGSRPGRQCIVAQAQIAEVKAADRDEEYDPPYVFSAAADRVLVLDEVRLLDAPVPIRPLMGEISILPKLRFWGALLMGGCRKMTAEDYDIIMDRSRGTATTS